MRVRLILQLLLALVAAAAVAMVPEDILDIRSAEMGDLSPDGRYLLYGIGTWDRDKETRLRTQYRRDLVTGEDLVIFTPADRSWGAVWRPDGQAIAYKRNTDDGVEIWLMAADGSERRRISDGPGSFGPLHWSLDGTALAWVSSAQPTTEGGPRGGLEGRYIIADHAGYRHLGEGFRRGKLGQLFVMDLANGQSRRLVDADLDVRSLSWSPDSRQLVFTAKAVAEMGLNLNTDLYLVNRVGGPARRLTENPGMDQDPRWLADGRVAWLRGTDPIWESCPRTIAVMEPRPGQEKHLQQHGTTLDQFFWRWTEFEGRFFALAANEGALDLVELAGDQVHWLTDFRHDFWSLQAGGGKMLLQGASQTHPGALFLLDLAGPQAQEPEKIIDPNADWINRVELIEPEVFHIEVAGRRIEGWYFKPAGLVEGQRAPVVLSIHGGPEWMYGGYFLPEFHILPSFGYGVVICNPTGSLGYGMAFQAAIRGDWVDRPSREVLAALQSAVDAGWADPERLAVMGGSYGGLLGAELTTRSQIFRAAALDRMYPDQNSFWGATDEKWFPEWEFGGRPWEPEARAVYEHNSPWLRVDRVQTPTLVSQGHLDFRCPATGGHMWFTALKARGIPSRFIRFEQEGHGIRDPRNQVFYQQQLLNWFEQHVLVMDDISGENGQDD
jgi:dipeptidyl aminopeptidase/acylaminoacyl peptidase